MAALVVGCLFTGSFVLADGTAVFAGGERIEEAAIKAFSVDRDGVEGVLVVDGEERELSGLVRWGEPRAAVTRTAVVLEDGSRLVCDRPWSPAGLARVDEATVRLRRGKGWVDFPRESVAWLLLTPEAVGLDVERLPSVDVVDGEDVVLLVGGDRLIGRVESLTNDTLRLVVADEAIDTPLESVAALRLSGGSIERTEAKCLVGLADGSLLKADDLTVANDSFTAKASGAEVTGEAATLVLIQPLASGVRYLSDLEPADYRHTPYLDLPWPYTRDGGLRGGPLVGGGRRAAKGIAMHTAARLVYRLDGSPQRFQAEIAVADPEPGAAATGSVSFRVYLVKEGKFEPANEGYVMRVGEAARPIDIDLAGAAALALVVDFADDGDAGDDALWLDARLVSVE
ncbi:NPCBM/NEW2 domain-containing protein [Botrimarina mediterranea]|uniref:NPCBM/NEW2 domain-containing protein n=1 Tax=Botrimarina mediterranea TaxID=2528022 RepID=UPI0018D44B60|nr:NPCBM/NEW2 domain-containing protein [Botrimarina mediterranea]